MLASGAPSRCRGNPHPRSGDERQMAVKSWTALREDRTPPDSSLRGSGGQRFTFADLDAQPARSSPLQSGAAWRRKTEGTRPSCEYRGEGPFPHLTGRAQVYQDHEWMLAFGEALPRSGAAGHGCLGSTGETGPRRGAHPELSHAPFQVVYSQHLLGHPHQLTLFEAARLSGSTTRMPHPSASRTTTGWSAST